MKKSNIRKIYLEKRRKFSSEYINSVSNIISNKILASREYKEATNILIYMDFDSEIKTEKIIVKALEDYKKVYIPKILSNTDMEFFRYNIGDDFKINKYNIKEPISEEKFNEDNALVIIPTLCYNHKMYRVGYGGGYYDRYLYNKEYMKVGICFKEFLINENFEDEFDIKLDNIYTN